VLDNTSLLFPRFRRTVTRSLALRCAALLLLPVGCLFAQAPSGPMAARTPADAEPLAPPPQAAAKPNLAGTWTLNKDKSDDPRKAMQEARGGGGGYGGPGGGGGYGGGGGHRGGGNRGGQHNLDEYNQLTITQSGPSVKVNGSSGRVLAVSSAASGGSASAKDADESAPSGDWQDSKFVVASQNERGGKTTRTYEVSPDGKVLTLTTRMDNPRFNQPVTFKFVYDAGNAPSNSSAK
jgi:hypothetical protein